MFLTPRQKVVFRLHRQQGWPQWRIADELRISRPSVNRLLARAEKRVTDLARQCGAGQACGLLEATLN